MKIKLTSVFVDDQDKALAFYTSILGFVKKNEFPAGKHKWLTVVSPEEPDTVELLLEPGEHPAASTYQKAIFDAGLPATAFFVDDIQAEYDRMNNLGVVFRSGPTQAGPAKIAIFEDTCGNLIQIVQV